MSDVHSESAVLVAPIVKVIGPSTVTVFDAEHPPASTTLTLYVPSATLLNNGLALNVTPPSMLYINGLTPPLAVIVIVPSSDVHSESEVEVAIIVKVIGPSTVTVLVEEQPPASTTLTL